MCFYSCFCFNKLRKILAKQISLRHAFAGSLAEAQHNLCGRHFGELPAEKFLLSVKLDDAWSALTHEEAVRDNIYHQWKKQTRKCNVTLQHNVCEYLCLYLYGYPWYFALKMDNSQLKNSITSPTPATHITDTHTNTHTLVKPLELHGFLYQLLIICGLIFI